MCQAMNGPQLSSAPSCRNQTVSITTIRLEYRRAKPIDTRQPARVSRPPTLRADAGAQRKSFRPA